MASVYVAQCRKNKPQQNGGIFMQKITVRQIAALAMLLAVYIVAGRFLTITLPTFRIGFTFLPVAIAGILFGPVWAGVLAALGDILATFLLPFGYFPPITISALLTGVLYGLFLYRKPASTLRIACCVLIVNIFISLFLQTYWLSLLRGVPYFLLLPERVVQNIITTPIHIICIRMVAYRVAALQKKEFA